MSSEEIESGVEELSAALERHGIPADASHVRSAAEWRPAMLDAVAAIRKLDLSGVEPDAVFSPITEAQSGGDAGAADG